MPYAQVKQELLPKLKPIIKVKGENYSLMMTDIGVLRVSDLKNSINNVGNQRQTIVDVLDFLFQGF